MCIYLEENEENCQLPSCTRGPHCRNGPNANDPDHALQSISPCTRVADSGSTVLASSKALSRRFVENVCVFNFNGSELLASPCDNLLNFLDPFLSGDPTPISTETTMYVLNIILVLSILFKNARAADGITNVPSGALLALKKEIAGPMVAGRNVTVSYSVHNVGSKPATQVQLKDLSYPQSRFEFDKPPRSVWDHLEPGQSVSHVVTLLPKRSGELYVSPASITYHDGDRKHTSKLAAEESFFVEDLVAFRRRTDTHTATWVIFSIAFIILGIVPFGLSQLMIRSLPDLASGKKKSS